jgi:predicted peptidase
MKVWLRFLQLTCPARAGPAFLLASLVTPAAAQQETGFLNRRVTLGGSTLRYQVYVPHDYTRGREWPVILFLHGAGERGSDGLRQTQVGLGTAVRQQPDRFPALVVMPQAPPDSIWRGTVAEAAVAALEAAVKEFRGDRRRIYLIGLSMGAYGAWTMGLKRPRMFAAIVAVCGGLLPPAHFTELEVELRESDRYAELARRLAHIPVWLFHGALDSLVLPVESRRIHAAFHNAGAKSNYTEYPDVGHESWDPAFADPMLWQWLFRQRR